MYKNCIRQTPINRNLQIFVRQAEIAYDERIAFIESVCWALIESRFGPAPVPRRVVKLSDRPEREPAVFYDLSDEMMSCYALSPVGRDGYQVVEAAYRKAKHMGLLAARPNGSNSTAALSPNLGRGSP